MQGDEVARLVIERYEKLPKRGKPLVRSNGVKEWTILAGIVIEHSLSSRLECVSVATGVKALPDQQLEANSGKAVHDSHAEILAIRAFNRYVMQTGLEHIARVYLYVCTPPCGDASMSLLNGEESWSQPFETSNVDTMLRGRAHFNLLGHIRTKPGRQDSVTTMSKSCTDKLCLRQSRGLLLAPARHLFERTVFLSALICPILCPDFERAFTRWQPRSRFAFWGTDEQFGDFHPASGVPSPLSVVWYQGGAPEILANGLLQGSKRPSTVSRWAMVEAARNQKPEKFAHILHYNDLKATNAWPPGWIRTHDDNFELPGALS